MDCRIFISLFFSFLIAMGSFTIVDAQVIYVQYKEFIVPTNKDYGKWVSSPEMKRKMREQEEYKASYVKDFYELYTNGLYSIYNYDTTIRTAEFDKGIQFGFRFESKNSYAKDLHSGNISIRTQILADSICHSENFYEKYDWKPRKGEKIFANLICKSMYSLDESKDTTIIWYSPEIAIPDGPSFYGGAPGLILAVEAPDKNYIAEEISSGNFPLENRNRSPEKCLSKKAFNEKIREAALKRFLEEKEN